MNIANLNKLNKKNIDSILKGDTTKRIEDGQALHPLYRLVSANKWYVLIYSEKKVDEFKKNLKFNISFQDIYDNKYSGKLLSEREDTRGYIYTFLMNDDVSALLRVRRINVTINNTFQGLKVPESAIKVKDRTDGVFVHEDNTRVFVPVNVWIVKGGSAVISPVDENSALKEGSRVEA